MVVLKSDWEIEAIGQCCRIVAMVLAEQQRFEEAEQLYNQVLKVRERTLGPDHPAMLIVRQRIANLYLLQGAFDLEQHSPKVDPFADARMCN